MRLNACEMSFHEIHLQTKRRDEMIDITEQVEALLVNVQEGLVVVYSHSIALDNVAIANCN